MATLGAVFQELNALKAAGVLADYAIGGATATLFYAEPTRTYDLDVFILLAARDSASLAPLASIYDWARARGFPEDAEHIQIHGVPVQFLPAHNSLAEEAVTKGRTLDYEGVPVKVIGPEHLAALALQTGGRRRRERAWQLIESGSTDRGALREILRRHAINESIDDDEG